MTQVRKVQEGQWLCQARRYMSTVFYNTRPAFLEVITGNARATHDNTGCHLCTGNDDKLRRNVHRMFNPQTIV